MEKGNWVRNEVNNADDYPKAGDDAAWVKKMVDDYKSAQRKHVSITPAPPRYVESPEYTKFLSTVTAYRAGDVAAAMALGTCYYNGTVTGKSHSAAFTTWLSVADRNMQARFLVGRMLYFGEGTPADTDRGAQLMRSAAARRVMPMLWLI